MTTGNNEGHQRGKFADRPAGTPGTPNRKRLDGADPATAPRVRQGGDSTARPRRRPAVIATGPDGGRIVTTGQTARTLAALLHAGPEGRTPWEFPRGFRLAAYVHDLRKLHGLAIDTIREESEGGRWRARYVLRSPVTIMEARP